MNYKMTNKNKGFTLVELIVVLVILAILAAILVPSLLGYIDEAKGKGIILEARYAYMDAQVAFTEFYGTDGELFQKYYDSRSNSGYTDDKGNTVRCCVITHQTLRSIQQMYTQGKEKKIQDTLDGYLAAGNYFSYGAYKSGYLILKQMNALDEKTSEYKFAGVNRASGITYDEFVEKYPNAAKSNPVIYQLYFDRKGRVVMLEYGKDGYLVRYGNGYGTIEKNGKTFKSNF